MILPDAAWRHRPGLDRLLAALDADAGETRFVGGAVRDTLLGLPVADLDLATRLKPELVRDRIREAGLKAVPTGLAHGTITAVLADGPVEVTTLRRDVSTDGRRATVAFSDDWREDAARRDFTINALYADPANGAVIDYFGGLDDLAAGRVRFIGDPLTRIAEDHLRILRFFRFHARFGKGAPDSQGYDACAARAKDLMALSRERIADELFKILAGDDPAAVIRLMIDREILASVLPEIGPDNARRLDALVAAEAAAAVAPDRIRRFIALVPADPAAADDIAARLRLSNAIRKRVALVLSDMPAGTPAAMGYRIGREAAIDRLLLAGETAGAASLRNWDKPTLPTSGGALVARGLTAGPAVARALRAIEERWIAEGFPGRERVDAIVDAELLQAFNPRQ